MGYCLDIDKLTVLAHKYSRALPLGAKAKAYDCEIP